MEWRRLLEQILGRLFAGLQPGAGQGGYLAETSRPEPAEAGWPVLTGRELQVAWGIRRGLSNDEIAAELGIATTTVKSHVHNLLVKFNLRSRWALRDVLNAADFNPWV
ncbi:MAG: response regulator transcription factor [Chloroflexota bacterium]